LSIVLVFLQLEQDESDRHINAVYLVHKFHESKPMLISRKLIRHPLPAIFQTRRLRLLPDFLNTPIIASPPPPPPPPYKGRYFEFDDFLFISADAQILKQLNLLR
jgi:hypothetical protein